MARRTLREASTSSTSEAMKPGDAAGLEPLCAKCGWIIALGAIYSIAGVIALGSVMMATVASVFIVGIMMVIAGVAEVINAFQVKTWGKFVFWLLLGALYIVGGFAAFENPLLAAAVLTLVLAAALIVSGGTRIWLAFGMRGVGPWLWVALSGVITLLLGLMILARWPVSSLYVLGLFLGIDLILAGSSWIGIGLRLRRGVPSPAACYRRLVRPCTARPPCAGSTSSSSSCSSPP
jgi:uncharacterized membrane protein HdeD (DUF308 family)